jgi:hypothetical protein
MQMIDPAPRNEKLWKMALRRAAFKKHAFVYFVVIGFLWVLWYFTSGFGSYPWPVWATGGWGIALLLHYWSAHRDNAYDVQNEYDKLVDEYKQAGKL